MISDLPLAIMAFVHSQNAGGAVEEPGLCWITSVQRAGESVRIHFPKRGGPMIVGHRGRFWSPADQPEERPFLVADLGEVLRPQNSHHDDCTIKVVRRDDVIGVEANARLHLPGLPLDERTEFIPGR